jgi:N-formylglutamate amidohydrolase
MKFKLGIAGCVALLALSTIITPVQADSKPDYQLRCDNGKISKVWLNPFRVENKCSDHSKQWVEVHLHQADEDVWIYNIAAGATYKTKYKMTGWHRVMVDLGRGTFCAEDDGSYIDINGVVTVYRKGSAG